MLNIKDEKRILNIIKYGPIILVIILSTIFSIFLINQKKVELQKDINILEEKYIQENKKRVKSLVERIYKRIKLEKMEVLKEINGLVKSEVLQAHSIAMSIYENNIKKPNYSKEKTIDEIKTALREIRFLNGSGYLFIYEMKGKNILNPQFPHVENKNLWNYKSARGTLLIQEMNKILKSKNETFYEWYWKKSENDLKEYKKTGYFKKFEPYDLFIGSGAHFEDLENSAKQKILYKINSLKFNKFEHVFIYTLDGLCLVNPKKNLVGKNRYNVKAPNGEYALKKSLQFVSKNKEGFRHYNATVKLNDNLNSNSKISFLKLFEDWNWMIGSGFYLESLNNEIREKENFLIKSNNFAIKNILIGSILISFIFVLISFYLSKQLEIKFKEYKIKILNENKKTLEKEKLLIQQSKMATMGEMLGSIAHQWKQPLSLLSLSSGLIRIHRENKEMFSEEEVDEALDNIDSSIKNLNQTIDDFRNFFNPTKERKLFSISDAFTETFKLISSQFRNNNIELIKEISATELYGSQNELQQVLINLLKNAKEELIKKDSLEKRYIFIETLEHNNEVVIKIKDNAQGVPLNIINKIFDPYFTTKENEGGSGIGLYMSKQIVEGSMKGKLEVFNVNYKFQGNDYKGAEFTIYIPIDLRANDR